MTQYEITITADSIDELKEIIESLPDSTNEGTIDTLSNLECRDSKARRIERAKRTLDVTSPEVYY